MTTKKKKTGRHPPKPKRQQATSREAIIRARAKDLAMEFRLQGFTLREIFPAINEALGPDGEDLPGFKPYKSPHAIEDMLREAIREAVDPLKKDELLTVTVSSYQKLLPAMMAPALQGSVPHAQQAQALLDKIAKLLGLFDPDDDRGGAGGNTVIFLNGFLAKA